MRTADLQLADRLTAGYPDTFFDIGSEQPFGESLVVHDGGLDDFAESLGNVFSDTNSIASFDSVYDIVFEIERGRFERLDFELTSLCDLIATYRVRGRRVVCMEFSNEEPDELFLVPVVLTRINDCLDQTDDNAGERMTQINNWITASRKHINQLAQAVDSWKFDSSPQSTGKRQLAAEAMLTIEVNLNAILSGTQAGIADAFLNRETPFETLEPNDSPIDQDEFTNLSFPYELELMPNDWTPENVWMKFKSRADNRGAMQQYAYLADQMRMMELYRKKTDPLLQALEELVQSR